MSLSPDALWINVSPALEKFDRPLLKQLSAQTAIAKWEYSQTPDEPTSLEIAVDLLHDYLKDRQQPIHLLGHSTSGLLGLMYARRYPEKVRSLTLLSVGVYPAVDWQAHYYAQLQVLPCSREIILARMVYNLFGKQSHVVTKEIIKMLENDLMSSLSPHSLYQRFSMFPGNAPVPMLICGSDNDFVVDSNLLHGWQPWLKEGDVGSATLRDRIWSCPGGRYFFHYFHSQLVSKQITKFWQLSGLFPKQRKKYAMLVRE